MNRLNKQVLQQRLDAGATRRRQVPKALVAFIEQVALRRQTDRLFHEALLEC